LRLELCLDPGGLLPAGAFIAALVFVLLFVGAALHAHGFNRSGDTAAAVIIAAAGVFAGYLFRPGEHRLVRRFLRELRFDTTVITGLAFAAAGLLAVNWPARIDAWTLLTLASFVILARRISAWATAEAIRRDVLPLHWLVRLLWLALRSVASLIGYVLRTFGIGLAGRQLWAASSTLVLINIGAAFILDWLLGRSGAVHVSQLATSGHIFFAAVWSIVLAAALVLSRLLKWPRGRLIGAATVIGLAGASILDILVVRGVGHLQSTAPLMWLVIAEVETVGLTVFGLRALLGSVDPASGQSGELAGRNHEDPG
jgi:hypothetical protein